MTATREISSAASTVAKTRPTSTTLASEQGNTTIADAVVAKIAGIAAREVAGVFDLGGGGVGSAMSGLAKRAMGGDMRGFGVSVEVGQREAAIDIAVRLDYGVDIPRVAEAIRANIVARIQAMTGLIAKEVNIFVTDLYFAEDDAVPSAPVRRVE